LTSPLLDTDEDVEDEQTASFSRGYVVCPFLRSYHSQILKFFKLCAEHGSARSYIIYLLFLNGKMHFYEIVKNLQMHPKHIHRVLKELKDTNIVNVDDYGYWFLTS